VGPLGGWEIGGKVSKMCFNFQHGGDAKPFGFLNRAGYGYVNFLYCLQFQNVASFNVIDCCTKFAAVDVKRFSAAIIHFPF